MFVSSLFVRKEKNVFLNVLFYISFTYYEAAVAG